MPKEQETWAEEWHRRVQQLTASLASDALRGIGLSVPTEDKAVFIQMHGVCVTWRAEAAQKRCEACVDKRCKVCWGEDKQVCRRCQMKRVGCLKSTKALREREMSEHSGVSKSKAKAIDRPGELEQGVSVPMPSVSRDVVEADLLPEDGRSLGAVLREAKEFPVKEEEESGQEDIVFFVQNAHIRVLPVPRPLPDLSKGQEYIST
ncbi:hypothetical protein PAXINDRAFT_15583 [Paxillus involutus ATCC 200175]|uniref:Uncharacterized protein n=1 Tax=Paxillus involutus ATCC 200175 TaxID=664439 RepID=A0A0C9TV14_PAXIN|nr:hypothetical protein PAXINDRAFT_15583 [Paxillus involutus ATCC 200175]